MTLGQVAGRISATLLLASVAAGRPAAEPPGAPDAPVRLDVVVTDRNDRPIRDLKLADFEVTDSGSDRPLDAADPGSSRESRVIAIFLDEYHVGAGESTERAREAVTRLVDHELRATDLVAIMKPLDPLNAIQITRDRSLLRDALARFSGRKGNYEPQTPFEASFMSRAPAAAEAGRAQVVSAALQALAMRIGVTGEGRKSIVLVSEGFSGAPPHAGDRLTGSVRAIVYAANRYGVAIYPVDPRAQAERAADDPGVTTIRALADQTGGRATFDGVDLAAPMAQALRDLDDYYVLTYRAAISGDGKFHPIQVRVKRPNAQIRIQSGYWAANAKLITPPPAPVRASALPARPPHASPLIRPWIGTARGADGLTRVTVSWEPGLVPPGNQRVGMVTIKATTDQGRVLLDEPIAHSAAFDAPPGYVHLELLIRDLSGRTLDSDYRGVQIPDFTAARPTFATIQVIRTRNAREFALASQSPDPAPAASREFSRAERLLIRVPFYASGGDSIPVTATLLNRLGTPMRTLDPVAGPLPPGMFQFDLPLSSLAPDDYRVELVAGAGGTGAAAKAVLPFRVAN